MSDLTSTKIPINRLSDEKDQLDTQYTLPNQNGYRYAVLMETSGEECESWYYSIRYEGNEINLKKLQDQLESVDWYILDDLSTFDLDLEHLISELTAKELTKLELNHQCFHRKFDGILDNVDMCLRTKDKNEKKMVKVFDILGYGQIEDYIDREDIDDEDLADSTDSNDSDEDKSGNDISDNFESTDEGIPVSLLKSNLPRFVRDKRKK
jgi:hypothetical protein